MRIWYEQFFDGARRVAPTRAEVVAAAGVVVTIVGMFAAAGATEVLAQASAAHEAAFGGRLTPIGEIRLTEAGAAEFFEGPEEPLEGLVELLRAY